MSAKPTPTLKVHSGNCCLCDIGLPVNAVDYRDIELHTGDIVMVWHGENIGADNEWWNPCDGLTAVVANQYQSYSGGTVTVIDKPFNPFVMGIADCGFDSPEWQIRIVKKYSEVIEDEHWKAYGFNYRHNEAADAALALAKGE